MKKVLYGTYYKPEGGESQTENGNIPQFFEERAVPAIEKRFLPVYSMLRIGRRLAVSAFSANQVLRETILRIPDRSHLCFSCKTWSS